MINSKRYYTEEKLDKELTWSEITDVYNELESTDYDNVRDILRRDLKALKKERELSDLKHGGTSTKAKYEVQKPTLVFSDTHFPYHREGYLEFLQSVHKQYGCNDFPICGGDLADNHAISFHEKEPDAYGHKQEEELALAEIERLVTVFPNLTILLGNHDYLIIRKAKSVGLSERHLKNFHQLWNLPNTVTVLDELERDGVFYNHGVGSTGKDGAINTAVLNQTSYVQGHTHSNGGVKWVASHKSLIFGMNTGCLFDPKSLAAAYGRHFPKRPTLGCGVVFNKNFAIFVPWVLE